MSPRAVTCHIPDERDRKEFGTGYRHDWYFGHDKREGGQGVENIGVLCRVL